MRSRNTLVCLAILAACTHLASARTLQVGPTRPYTTIPDALNAAASGDVIEVDSGRYDTTEGWGYISTSNITLRGVGPTRPVMDGHYGACAMKGYFIVNGSDVTIDNFEIKDVRLNDAYDGNGSGIRVEGGNLTVRNCYIHDCDDGIMGGYNTGADITVEYCEFANCGSRPGMKSYGFTHNLYIGTCRTFTLQYCYSHGVAEGHTVKTRALTSKILYNLLTSEDGTGSRELQFAQGGTAYVIGNVIIQGSNSHNAEIIAYGGEGLNANPYLYIVNNTIINQRSPATVLSMSNTATEAVFKNNVVQWLGNETLFGGTYANKVSQTGNWTTTNAFLRDPANRNYHLTTASTGALGAAVAPGTGYNNVALTPVYQYVFPYAGMTRPTNGTLDVGAYEYTNNQAPTVSAGPDLNVYEGLAVSLHAAASDPDGDPLTYTWMQQAGLGITLTGSGPDISFTAPAVTRRADASATFQVSVSDGLAGASATVNIRVRLMGDVTRDDTVNVLDLLSLAAAWASKTGDATYNAACDLNADGAVDAIDLASLANNWTRTLP